MPVLLAVLPILGVVVYVSHVIKYLNSEKTENINENKPQTFAKTTTVVDCCLKVNFRSKAGVTKRWKENFCDKLPAEVCVQVIEKFKDKLYDYIDGKNDSLDIRDMTGDIEINFSVEYEDDKLIDIKGLDKFQTDLNNNVYSTVECSNLIWILTEILFIDDRP